jgi:hypothetical protein
VLNFKIGVSKILDESVVGLVELKSGIWLRAYCILAVVGIDSFLNLNYDNISVIKLVERGKE